MKDRNKAAVVLTALKHVSDDMKTHKNPALKAQSGLIRSGPKPFSASKPDPPKPVAKKEPALLELEGKKWRLLAWCPVWEAPEELGLPKFHRFVAMQQAPRRWLPLSVPRRQESWQLSSSVILVIIVIKRTMTT